MRGGLLIGIGLLGLGGAVYAALSFVFSGLPLSDYLRWVFSFACLGLLLGVIHVFDGASGRWAKNRPVPRLVAGCLCGGAIAVIWHWPAEALVLAAIVGGGLGLLGAIWAKWMVF